MSQTHGYLDKFTIIGQAVYAEGWGNNLDPKLYYDGIEVASIVHRYDRPEIAAMMGSDRQDWGFKLVAMLPAVEINREKFRLQFSQDLAMDHPASRFAAPDDVKFEAMVSRFRGEVANKPGHMLEIGSRARSGRSYRDWFSADTRHTGIDITDGPNVDVVGDAHHLSRHLRDRFDFAFSIAVFEHILMPWKVALEMNKVLKRGAPALIISHGSWPLHEEPWDFFRFSKESWGGIFNKHTGFEMIESQYQYPASIIPNYISTVDFQNMSQGRTFLLSGCLVRKIGVPQVEWEAEAGDVYNLSYSHA